MAYCRNPKAVHNMLHRYFRSDWEYQVPLRCAFLHIAVVPDVQRLSQGLLSSESKYIERFRFKSNVHGPYKSGRSYTILDLLILKAGAFIENIPEFNALCGVVKLCAERGIPVVSAFSTRVSEWLNDRPVAEDLPLWKGEGMRGVGCVLAAFEAGCDRDIKALEYPAGKSFFYWTLIRDVGRWIVPGPVAQECIRRLRRRGATTRLAFAEAEEELLDLSQRAIQKLRYMDDEIVSPDDTDRKLVCFHPTVLDWEDKGQRQACYEDVLGRITYKLWELRVWHHSEASLASCLKRILSHRLPCEQAKLIVTFMIGTCSCEHCII